MNVFIKKLADIKLMLFFCYDQNIFRFLMVINTKLHDQFLLTVYRLIKFFSTPVAGNPDRTGNGEVKDHHPHLLIKQAIHMKSSLFDLRVFKMLKELVFNLKVKSVIS